MQLQANVKNDVPVVVRTSGSTSGFEFLSAECSLLFDKGVFSQNVLLILAAAAAEITQADTGCDVGLKFSPRGGHQTEAVTAAAVW